MKHVWRIWGLSLAGLVAFLAVILFVSPITQDSEYHNFADSRGLLGIPNFGDVAGNMAFIIAAFLGFRVVRPDDDLRIIWRVFFTGVFLTALGSAYYHLAPDNARLVWDRLPMTISFVSLFCALVAERIDKKAGLGMLLPAILLGIASVFHWEYTEAIGQGDLRLYIYVQFFPMLCIPAILVLFPARHKGTPHLLVVFVWYFLAKVTEHYDDTIFGMTGNIVSGHTLKHLCAAASVAWVVKYIVEVRNANA
ncbi:MAG: alkaline phytoceramidase [Alphaproteobacteria bacterium]|nr:alkaline phytoceramidase [Alphaproteobacteria bacterium]